LQSLSGYIVQSAICSNKCFVMVCRNLVIAFPSQRADIEPSTEDRHGQNNKLFNHFNKKMQLRRVQNLLCNNWEELTKRINSNIQLPLCAYLHIMGVQFYFVDNFDFRNTLALLVFVEAPLNP